jgi:hypothetical protein
MKKKLKLSDIKVSSFVTALNENDSKTIQGGAEPDTGNTAGPTCISNVAACVNTHAAFCTDFPSAYDACPTFRGCTIEC